MSKMVCQFLIFSALFVTSAFAQETRVGDDASWKYRVTPYLVLASVNGSTGIAGVVAEVDMSFEEILKNLDAAFMVGATASKGRWTFAVDFQYFKVSNQATSTTSGPFGQLSSEDVVELSARQMIFQPTVLYRFSERGGSTVDAYVAARYSGIEPSLYLTTTNTGIVFPGGSRSLTASESWWDPIVGSRVVVPFASKYWVMGIADVGGFGISSDVTYQLLATVGRRLSEQVSASVGYRYLRDDYENGEFLWDSAMYGFLLGVGFTF